MKSLMLMAIPLGLAAFTHLWNPIGFPSIYVDEAHYMRRTMSVLEGLGPQESAKIYHHPYDHPYFGQIFLASIFETVGYPNSLNLLKSDNTIHSMELLYVVPRLVTGVLAVVDTFFVYKIVERRYDRKVAFIASVLFAVMPLGWFIRRIWLESIQLPLLLISILLVAHPTRQAKNDGSESKGNSNILTVLTSGIFLGLAIFTKIPAFVMIPLVGYLVYTANNRSTSILRIWLIPVITISLIWPAYALSLGQFDDWSSDVFWQTSRIGEGDTVSQVFIDLLKIDPLLLVLGAAGLIMSVVRKDLFLFLWTVPYIIFSYTIVHSSYWYFIPLFPAVCIGAARLVVVAINLIHRKTINQILSFGIISAIGVFGLISSTILITTNVTSSYFKAAEFIAQSLPTHTWSDQILVTGGVGLASYTWIPIYIFGMDHDFRMLHNLFSTSSPPKNTTDAMFVVDKLFDNAMVALTNIQKDYELRSLVQLLRVYNSTRTIASFTGNTDNFDTETYPYYTMKFNNQLTPSGPDRIDIRSNFQPVFFYK